MSVEQFYNIIELYELSVSDFKIRAYDDIDNRITIGGVLSDNGIIEEEKLDHFLGNSTFEGIIACTIEVNNSNINFVKKLNKDANVYTVSTEIYNVKSKYKNKDKTIDISPVVDVFWELEDYNTIK